MFKYMPIKVTAVGCVFRCQVQQHVRLRGRHVGGRVETLSAGRPRVAMGDFRQRSVALSSTRTATQMSVRRGSSLKPVDD